MHDRTINGETYIFGNAGGLYKNAMTWFDHKTQSIWSQPTGEVLGGPLLGTKLQTIAFQLTTWENWITTHPETQVMENGLDRVGISRERFSTNFLIGVELAEFAKAYQFEDIMTNTVVEDQLGSFPLLIWAEGEDFRVFLRRVGEQELHFYWDGDALIDDETGSSWDPKLGLARSGEYQGQVLQQIPSFSIWLSSWYDFFPQGEIFRPE